MSTKPRFVVLITDPMAAEGIEQLKAEPGFDVRIRNGLGPDALLGEVAEADALLVRSGTKVTEAVLAAAPRLRVVGRAGTGVDNIDVNAATRRGVVVMNTPGGNSVAACEHTFALLLALFRHVPVAATDLAAGNWNRKKFMGRQLAGRTLGLVGFGRIGREVATRARAFGMDVIVSDPFVAESLVREWDARRVEIPELFRTADVISLHIPRTKESEHLIDAAAIDTMKTGAVIVNCARGGLIDEAALLAGLESGKLGGAALDVFETEPPQDLKLLSHPRVVATPHLGASTEEAQLSVAADIAVQVRDYLVQGEIRNAVNVPSLSADVYEQVRPYLDLTERLGSLAAQIAGTPVQAVTVTFRGDCTDLPRAPLVSAALIGILGQGATSVVNYVNARVLASELGVEVEEKALTESGDHAGLIEISVRSKDGACTVAGVVTAAGRPRLARWEGLGLDAPPVGDLLALRNPDVPGVVGSIGMLLGDAGLNIAHIAWGRDDDAGEAFTLINLDSPVLDDTFATIRGHEKVLWAARVRLP